MAFLLISIKAGMEHVMKKISVLPKGEFEVGQDSLLVHRLPEIIRTSGNSIVEMYTMTKDKELDVQLHAHDKKFTELTRASREILQNRRPMTHGATEDRPSLNCLRAAKGISAFGNYSDIETDFGEFDAAEDEISRDEVKKASSNIIAMEERRKLRSTKPLIAE